MTTTGKQCKATRSRLSEGRGAGLEVIELDNGVLRVLLLPQRGMGLWKVYLGDREFGWRSPVAGPVHPMLVPLCDPSGLGWLEGFDELLCRCGLQSNGPPVFDAAGRLLHPQHGRVANLPAQDLEIRHDPESGRMDVVAMVVESRFHHANLRLTSTLSMRPGEAAFAVSDEVMNASSRPGQCQLLYHYNIGLPVLGEGARIVAPIRELAPKDERAAQGIRDWATLEAPTAGFEEQVYFSTLKSRADGSTRVLLESADGETGTSLRFNVHQLGCFVVWKNCVAAGDGYAVGIEPGTNFPNPRPFEAGQGRVIELPPGQSCRFDVGFEFHAGATCVRDAEAEIESLRGGTDALVHPRPRAGWSPDA